MADLHRPSIHLGSRLRRFAPAGAVLAGGLLGSLARSGVGSVFRTEPGSFPMTTLIVNVGGSFLLGVYLSRRERSVTSALSLQFVAIGVLGSLTTFSTFSVETFQLMDAGRAFLVVAYSGASIVGGLTAALVGDRLGRISRWH